jgi:hypothetical protein
VPTHKLATSTGIRTSHVNVGPTPELIVGSDGRIVRAINVTVNGVFEPTPGTLLTGQVNVGNIYNDDDSGDIVMEAIGGTITESFSDKNSGTHFWGTFTFEQSFDEVRITNESSLDLVINTIDLVHSADQPRSTSTVVRSAPVPCRCSSTSSTSPNLRCSTSRT